MESYKNAFFTTVCPESFGETRCNGRAGEREVSAQLTQAGKESLTSHSSEGQKASGKPDALFSSEQGNLIRSSVFRNAYPSNLRGSLLEGKKDHLLNQARSDLAKQELHVESLNKCIGEQQQQTEEQRLALQDAQYGFVESRREQVRLQKELSMKEKILRNTQISHMHEMGEIKRAQEHRIDEVSVQKLRENHETIQQLTSQFQQMQEQMNSVNDSGDIFKLWSQIMVEGCLNVSSQPVMIRSSRSLLSRELQEIVFGNQFSTFDSPRDRPHRIQSDDVQRNREAVPEAGRTKTIHTSEDRLNQGTCDTGVVYEFHNASEISAELLGRTAKTAHIGIAIRHIPLSTFVLCVENSIQNTIGCYVVDQRIGDGDSLDELKSSRSAFTKGFSKLRDAGREDCLCSEQDHPEFPVQEECQPRGTECPERGPVSTRKTDRLHDLRLLSSDWRS